MKLNKKLLGYSVAIGTILTLFSSFFTNSYVIGEFPDVQIISIPMLGVEYYGHPLPWMRQIVYPGAQAEIIWSHFVIDVILWGVLILLLKNAYYSGKSSKRLAALKSKSRKRLSRKKPKTKKKAAKAKASKASKGRKSPRRKR